MERKGEDHGEKHGHEAQLLCVVSVVLLHLKSVAVEKRKFVVLVAYTSPGQLILTGLGESGHLNW